MQVFHCPNCGQPRGFRRSLGFGTLFAVVLTCGAWILALPFYPVRCIQCGLTRHSAWWHSLGPERRKVVGGLGIALGIVIVACAIFERNVQDDTTSTVTADSSSTHSSLASRPAERSPEGPAAIGDTSPGESSRPLVPAQLASTVVTSAGKNPEPGAESYSWSSTNRGYKTYMNGRFGFAIDFPQSFLEAHNPDNGDGVELISEDQKAMLRVAGGNNPGFTLAEYYAAAIQDLHCDVSYQKLGLNWFVISWMCPKEVGYTKMFVGRGSENSFTLTYPVAEKGRYENVVIRMGQSFKAGDLMHPQ
jgi:hypothetical protein